MYKTTMYGKLSWTLQRGPESVRRRYSETTTYSHLPWIPSSAACLPRPATFQVPTLQTSGAPTALLFSAPVTLLDDSHVDNIHLPLSQEMMPSRAAPKYSAPHRFLVGNTNKTDHVSFSVTGDFYLFLFLFIKAPSRHAYLWKYF